MTEYENMYDCNKKVEDDRLSTIEVSITDHHHWNIHENHIKCGDRLKLID